MIFSFNSAEFGDWFSFEESIVIFVDIGGGFGSASSATSTPSGHSQVKRGEIQVIVESK